MTVGTATRQRAPGLRRPRTLAALLVWTLATALTPLVAAPAPAEAASVTETYQLPADGTFQLSGRGYGHGIGMSQFGAEGMGRLGRSYRDILAFYYPGTTLETISPDRAIRVALSSMTRRELGTTTVTVVPRRGLTATAGRSALDLPTSLGGQPVDAYRVLRGAGGLTVSAYAGAASRQLVTDVSGGVSFGTAAGVRRSKVTVLSGGGSPRSYHGHLVVQRSTSGLLVVDELLFEHYLRAVVSLEVPGSWTSAALQAQAVAARSYALLTQRNARAVGQRYDICDTTSCQAFGSIATESTNEVAAVRATSGEYLASGGEPAFTQFSSSNGGWSVAGSRSYLVAQEDPYDGVVPASENWGHSWSRTVTARALEAAWPAIGRLKSLKVLGRDGDGAWGGRVQTLAVVGSAGTVTVSGDSFRWALGLKSTWWVVTNAGTSPSPAAKPAPRSVQGVALDRSIKVTWDRPATDRTVTGYVVHVEPGDLTQEVPVDRHRVRVRGLVNGVTYRAKVAAVYGSGTGDRAGTGAVVPTSPESYFRSVPSTRIWAGRQVASIADGGAATLTVAGPDLVPLAGTRSVLLRVTASSAQRGDALAWRTGRGGPRLTAATFSRGDAATGTVSVPVSADGQVSIGTTVAARNLTVDLVGYYTVSGVNSWSFHATPAARVADSHTGTGMPQGRIRSTATTWVRVAGRAGLPDTGVRAVLVNAALIAPRQDAQLSLAPPDRPFGSGIAVRARADAQRVAAAVVRLDDRGRIPLRLSAGSAHVAVDVLGWYGPHDGSAHGRFRASSGLLLDPTRDGPMGDGEVATLTVAGVGRIPQSVGAVMVLVRAYGATHRGTVSVRPAGAVEPRRPSVVFDDRGPTRNLVAVPVGTDGRIEVSVAGDAADVSVRVVGWYS